MSGRTIEVLPGLVLDEAMFEDAAATVAEYAPEQEAGFTRARFLDPQSWALIPDECLRTVKAEMVISDYPQLCRKINVWYLPDLRDGAKAAPHSHPWEFTSRIIRGGYSEDRYDLDGDQVRTEYGARHGAGSANHVPRALYHEVVEIHEPGTMTLMVCERGVRGAWGYLDVDRGVHRPGLDEDPAEFMRRYAAANPHLNRSS